MQARAKWVSLLIMKSILLLALLGGVRASSSSITACNVGSNLCECKGTNFTLDISAYADFP